MRANGCRCEVIRAAGQGIKGIWLLFAAAVDPRIQKVWLDRTPFSFSEALHNTLNTNLYDAVIYGFALHWDLESLHGRDGRPSPCFGPTRPIGWKSRQRRPPVPISVVLGDLTDMSTTGSRVCGESLN